VIHPPQYAPDPANHHFVPQFVLRNFAQAGTGKVAAFDKRSDRYTHVGIRNAAQAPGFNSDEHGSDELERAFWTVENPAARVVRKIVTARKADLEADESRSLRRLLLAQTLRTPVQRRVNTQFAHENPWVADGLGLGFDDSGDLTQSSQLQFTAWWLQRLDQLAYASWRLGIMIVEEGAPGGFLIPDNGCVVYHPQLAKAGWVDAAPQEMSSVVMPLAVNVAALLTSPAFDPDEGVPSVDETNRAAWARADRFVYGNIDRATVEYLSRLQLPNVPADGAPLP